VRRRGRARGGRAGEEWKNCVISSIWPTGDHDFVPRLGPHARWASCSIRSGSRQTSSGRRIRELGLGYGVVTPYTSCDRGAGLRRGVGQEHAAVFDLSELNQSSADHHQAQESGLSGATRWSGGGREHLPHRAGCLAQFAGTPAQAWNVDLSLFQGRADWPGGPSA
jgi:hypothetical protein